MGLSEKLMRIQTQIKAPKNLYNSFGNYKYRNAEGICEAVKPYLEREKVVLTLSDEVIEVGNRVYIQAQAKLADTESDECMTTLAFAREADNKKGMDASQITGTASSYARKYALNGLFLLDDTKDADSDEYKVQMEAQAARQKDDEETAKAKDAFIDDIKKKVLTQKAESKGIELSKILDRFKIDSLDQMTMELWMRAMAALEKTEA